MESLTNNIKYSEARHLPIVTGFAQKLRIVEEVDRLFDGEMEFSPGRVVLELADALGRCQLNPIELASFIALSRGIIAGSTGVELLSD